MGWRFDIRRHLARAALDISPYSQPRAEGKRRIAAYTTFRIADMIDACRQGDCLLFESLITI
jgi:hypothetical protein